MWEGYGGRGLTIMVIMPGTCGFVGPRPRVMSTFVDGDRNGDRNLGARRLVMAAMSLTIDDLCSMAAPVAAAVDEPVDGGDAAVEACGAGVARGGIDARRTSRAASRSPVLGVAFGEPGLVEGDFAGMVVVVAGEGSRQQRFGGRLGWPSSMWQRAAMTSISAG